MELLEWLRISVGCDFISELRFGENNELARLFIKTADFEKYTMAELSDSANYIFGQNIKFNTLEEARSFFLKHAKKLSVENKACT